MAKTSGLPALTPTTVRETLTEWFAKRKAGDVEFRERTTPASDPDARDRVSYQAVFEPVALDRARVELSVTAEGHIAIGYETRTRMAERLGVNGDKGCFAAGHKPHRMTKPGLLAVLDAAADGDIAITSVVLPVLGLVATRAVMRREGLQKLGGKGYAPLGWLEGERKAVLPSTSHLLRFYKW